MKPESVVLPIHFEDRSGNEFERLCFAYVIRDGEWKTIDWYGRLGGDGGRDIWGVRPDRKTHCYQCANYGRLTFKKAKDDIAKIVSGPNKVPNHFVLIVGGTVSATMKERVVALAKSKGVKEAEVWTGVEFEERLRRDQPVLLKRFCDGDPFPETPDALRAFGTIDTRMDDGEILALMAECFERPAFTTPFHNESNIPHFKKAITDTIEALNTGIRRLRDGTEIIRIPSRHQLKGKPTKDALGKVVQGLTELRTTFDELVRDGDVRPCGCGNEDCPVMMVEDRAAREMDRLRVQILTEFASVYPGLRCHLPPARRRERWS